MRDIKMKEKADPTLHTLERKVWRIKDAQGLRMPVPRIGREIDRFGRSGKQGLSQLSRMRPEQGKKPEEFNAQEGQEQPQMEGGQVANLTLHTEERLIRNTGQISSHAAQRLKAVYLKKQAQKTAKAKQVEVIPAPQVEAALTSQITPPTPMERGRQKAIADAQKTIELRKEWTALAEKENELSLAPEFALKEQGKMLKMRSTGEGPVGEQNIKFAFRERNPSASVLKERHATAGAAIKSRSASSVSARQSAEAAKQSSAAMLKSGMAKQAKARVQKQAEERLRETVVKKAKKVVAAARKRAQKSAKQAAQAAAMFARVLIAAVGGGIFAFLLFLVLALGAVIASPFGIFAAGENDTPGTITPSAAIAQVNEEYTEKLEEIQSSFEGSYSRIETDGTLPDWREVPAVFAVKVAGSDGEDATDVATFDEDRVKRLKKVFWDMVEVWGEVVEVEEGELKVKVLILHIESKTVDEMREFYHFTEYQNTALDALLDELGMFDDMLGDLTITQEDALKLLENLPADLDPDRKVVIEKALTLVGKVNYFWGGKSNAIGWDSRWGTMQKVTAPGSQTTGTYRPYGLDCSGFVDWVFNNALGYKPGHGGGAASQHDYCTPVSWADAQPGDLVFYGDDSHVGIVGGRDEDGNLLIIHCSSGSNNVVISGKKGFDSVGRPEAFR